MDKLKNNKSAFAFSLFAFFIVFLIYGFGSLYFFEGDYSQNTNFNKARILFINNEITYFKDVYLKNVLAYSLYSTLDSLLNYTSTNYTLNKNYDKLNELIKEGLVNGSFENINQVDLQNKTIDSFIQIFQQNFNDNYRGTFDYQLIKLNIFEKDSYYVTLQVVMQYNVTTKDNISEWKVTDEFEVSVPIYELTDPEFLLQDNLVYTIRPAEYYKANSNWTLQTLNETLTETYSSVYFEPNYKYSIGTSFINRLLNYSQSSYDEVLGFWSFDYDKEELGIYDSSLNNQLGKHYGNTRLLLNFDNSSTQDLSAYNNNVTNFGASISNNCISEKCYSFNGIDNYIKIQNSPKLNELGDGIKSYSISFWTKVNSISNSANFIGKLTTTISPYPFYCHLASDIMLSGNDLRCHIRDELGNTLEVISNEPINDSKYHNYVFVVKEGKGLELYMDGSLVGETYVQINGNYSNIEDIQIGARNNNNFIDGLIDEVAIYSKALSANEIASSYISKKADFIDYQDSLYGQGIEFDGVDDYAQIDANMDFVNRNFSIEIWFNRYSNISTSDFLIGKKNSSQSEWYLDFNNDKIRFNLANNTNQITSLESVYSLPNNDWNYVVITYNTSSSDIKLYVNSIAENLKKFKGTTTNTQFNITLGSDLKDIGNKFNGIIDEVKIYNKTLTNNEIKMNYYNYASNSKGCCNYLNLINPNKMGYNISPKYDNNISYSSKLFYDYYKRGFEFKNISLVRLQNLTSNITTKSYYNLNMDFCLMNAYNIFDYAGVPIVIDGENKTNSCQELIRLGVY